jgi:hypothetical protein
MPSTRLLALLTDRAKTKAALAKVVAARNEGKGRRRGREGELRSPSSGDLSDAGGRGGRSRPGKTKAPRQGAPKFKVRCLRRRPWSDDLQELAPCKAQGREAAGTGSYTLTSRAKFPMGLKPRSIPIASSEDFAGTPGPDDGNGWCDGLRRGNRMILFDCVGVSGDGQ